jgi:uncharacterized protein
MLRRRLFRFSLCEMLIIVTDFDIWLEITVLQIRRQRCLSRSQFSFTATTAIWKQRIMKIKKSLILVIAIALIAAEAHCAEAVKKTIEGQDFVADLYSTEGSTKKLGVLVLGGSEGGMATYLAKPFADAGYPTVTLAYFKTKGTPESLDEIPLEYFDKPIDWMKANEQMPDGIVMVGGSKGAELALLLASKHPEIKGVIALAPSSVVWQGIPKVFWPPRSSWTLGGQPLPFVSYDISQGFDPNNLLALYQQSLKQKEAVAKATIEAEKIGGPILLFSGRDDKMWPSAEMGDAICERLKSKQFAHKYEHIKYDDAGHTLNEYFMLGGTAEGNKKAREDSTKRMLEFVESIKVE